ncbi:hypothetical protein [Nonlabens spongiae]|uniref:hypothetical protein n=1 Tax=Nonlabens spongiae TaxID=331648 RepID=UPI0012F4A800|nr:hypothetical protein [Nonlabens spongiae]
MSLLRFRESVNHINISLINATLTVGMIPEQIFKIKVADYDMEEIWNEFQEKQNMT